TLSTKYAKRIVFNKETTPDMLIIEAVVASCALPLLFTPFYYKEDIISDGGLLIGCPFKSIDSHPFINCQEICHKNCNNNCNNTLGLIIDYKQDDQQFHKLTSWFTLLKRYLEVPLLALTHYELTSINYQDENNEKHNI